MARPITEEMIKKANEEFKKDLKEALEEEAKKKASNKLNEDIGDEDDYNEDNFDEEDIEDEEEEKDPEELAEEALKKYRNYLNGYDDGITYEEYYDYCVDLDIYESDIDYPDEDDDDIDIRALVLAKYLGVPYYDVEDEYENEYSVDGDEYLVLDYDEAEELARDRLQDYIEDMGILSYLGDSAYYYIDEDSLWDWIRDDACDWWDGETNEDIIQEAIDRGIIEEEDVYEIDEEESLEQGEIVYKDEYKEGIDIRDLVSDLADGDIDGYSSPEDYMEEKFGRDWIDEMRMEDYVDIDAYIDDNLENEMAGLLATYDGEELDLGHGYYGYREN